jgi:hypothetical protein
VCCANCQTNSTSQWGAWSTSCGHGSRTRKVTVCTDLGLPTTVAACATKCSRYVETGRRDDEDIPCPCQGSSLTLNSTTQQNISCGHNLPACPTGSQCDSLYAVCCITCPVAGTTAGEWGAWSASCGYATRSRSDRVCANWSNSGYYVSSGCKTTCQNTTVYDKRSTACPVVPYPFYPAYPSPSYPSYPAPAPSYPSQPAPAPS